jgi:hypothetical protein
MADQSDELPLGAHKATEKSTRPGDLNLFPSHQFGRRGFLRPDLDDPIGPDVNHAAWNLISLKPWRSRWGLHWLGRNLHRQPLGNRAARTYFRANRRAAVIRGNAFFHAIFRSRLVVARLFALFDHRIGSRDASFVVCSPLSTPRHAWGSGPRGGKPDYTRLDVIIVRDDKIAALYVFLDPSPP